MILENSLIPLVDLDEIHFIGTLFNSNSREMNIPFHNSAYTATLMLGVLVNCEESIPKIIHHQYCVRTIFAHLKNFAKDKYYLPPILDESLGYFVSLLNSDSIKTMFELSRIAVLNRIIRPLHVVNADMTNFTLNIKKSFLPYITVVKFMHPSILKEVSCDILTYRKVIDQLVQVVPYMGAQNDVREKLQKYVRNMFFNTHPLIPIADKDKIYAWGPEQYHFIKMDSECSTEDIANCYKCNMHILGQLSFLPRTIQVTHQAVEKISKNLNSDDCIGYSPVQKKRLDRLSQFYIGFSDQPTSEMILEEDYLPFLTKNNLDITPPPLPPSENNCITDICPLDIQIFSFYDVCVLIDYFDSITCINST